MSLLCLSSNCIFILGYPQLSFLIRIVWPVFKSLIDAVLRNVAITCDEHLARLNIHSDNCNDVKVALLDWYENHIIHTVGREVQYHLRHRQFWISSKPSIFPLHAFTKAQFVRNLMPKDVPSKFIHKMLAIFHTYHLGCNATSVIKVQLWISVDINNLGFVVASDHRFRLVVRLVNFNLSFFKINILTLISIRHFKMTLFN